MRGLPIPLSHALLLPGFHHRQISCLRRSAEATVPPQVGEVSSGVVHELIVVLIDVLEVEDHLKSGEQEEAGQYPELTRSGDTPPMFES